MPANESRQPVSDPRVEWMMGQDSPAPLSSGKPKLMTFLSFTLNILGIVNNFAGFA